MRTCHLHDFHSRDRDVPIKFPPLADIATAFVFVGLLFFLRFILAVRRLRGESRQAEPFLAAMAHVRIAGSFGDEYEPERRHALRQIYIGVVFWVVGFALLFWILMAHLFEFTPPIGTGA
ncbi:hypothetical protein NS226_13550 [Aureimonas ureilytica]|uniref:Uncharacterized protein n=1 Tax=Aureimonas ureilytica TaxID=401562 RepID=A0A175R792_9HYPH|nr:hypothetical protein NS226_13550 [Aureimonas ureilytica]